MGKWLIKSISELRWANTFIFFNCLILFTEDQEYKVKAVCTVFIDYKRRTLFQLLLFMAIKESTNRKYNA